MTGSNGSEQLPLHLPWKTAQARDDLVVTRTNEQAIAFLDSWPDWPTSVAILAGPTGAGKTHLAHVWAAKMNAQFLTAGIDTKPENVPDQGCHVVEDLAQGTFSEAWLFHLINATRASGASLLLTSRRWPSDWGVSLPDLQSRLKAAHLMELSEPDDDLLLGVLTKLFSDRQLIVEPKVIEYLVLRIERSLAAAQNVVAKLDSAALANKRAVTKPLAASVLQEMGL